jgi:Spy/CpxP family protein refolding chaperone
MIGTNRSTACRRRTWIALVSLALTVSVGAVSAQGDQEDEELDEVEVEAEGAPSERPRPPGRSRRDRREAGLDQDRMLERMTRELSLSEKQQADVKEILAAQALKRDALREGAAAELRDRGEVFQEMMDLRVETNGQIEAVLDDAQREKFTQLREKRRKRLEEWGGRSRGERGGPPGKPPGQ